MPETIHVGDDAVLTVKAMNGQYRIEADPEQWDEWPDPMYGLTTGEDGWIAVLTGTQHGLVTVRFQFRDSAPRELEPGWDMVGERDLICEDTTVRVKDLFSNVPPHVVVVTPGRYRLRIHVADREAAQRAGVATINEAIEKHFIQMWATGESAETVLLTEPDEKGRRYIERALRSQRPPTDV
jgi:hypothetical protein